MALSEEEQKKITDFYIKPYEKDPKWDRQCPKCTTPPHNYTHQYLDDEWICFRCLHTWPHESKNT